MFALARRFLLHALSFLSLVAGPAWAQASYAEVEPNDTKAQATVIPPLAAGDRITGVSDPIFSGSVDVFRVRTAGLPGGVYRHRLTISATGATTGPSILGRTVSYNPASGYQYTGLDAAVQTGTAPWASSWYGFGQAEEIYVQVPQLSTVSIPYTLTLSTAPASITPIPGTFAPGSITITTMSTSTADTSIHVYDTTPTAVVAAIGYANDDETLFGTSKQSYLVRPYGPGTHYVAISSGGTAWSAIPQPDEQLATALANPLLHVLNVAPALARPAGPTTAQVWDFRILAPNGAYLQSAVLPANPTQEILWFSFTVAANAPMMHDLCANATPILAGEPYYGTFTGATNDAVSACDPGGASSRDVWFKYTNTSASDVAFRVNTCGTLSDTALSILTSCGGTELSCSDDCLDPVCGLTTSCASALVTSGQTVFVRVSDKGLGGTNFVLNPSVELSNDECTAPKALPGAGDYPIDNAYATTSAVGQTESACNFVGGTGIARDLWYTYTPPIGGSVQVTTCGLVGAGPSDDSKIAVYAGTACPTPGSAIACSDTTLPSCGGGSTNPATVTFNAVCGTTYLIQIGMSPLSTSWLRGSFRLQEFGPVYGAWCYSQTTTFCTGDAPGSCPAACGLLGAPGRGCPNSLNPFGAGLLVTGIASVTPAFDTLVLTASGITGPGLFFQSGNPPGSIIFGDGRLCVFSGLFRLGVVFPSGGTASYPGGSTPIPLHLAGGAFLPGTTRHYQCWYRDAAVFCMPETNNVTSAVSVTWYP